MKKSLIALAVAGTFAAPAFAASSNVDIYGIVNVSVNRVDADVANRDNSLGVVSNASRLGLKGSEDLGGGLAAIWQIEASINAEEVSGSLGGRNTFVGLKGGFGTVLMGQHDTPMKLLGRSVDNFGDTMADSRNLLGADNSTGTTSYDLRTKNTIAYISPNFSGLTAILAYVADHQGGLATPTSCSTSVSGLDCNVNDAWSASATYNNGPLMLGAGYEKHNIAATTTTEVSRHIWRLVGGYTLGDLKLGAQYENASADNVAALNPSDRNAWGLFANYAMGAITLKANYLSVGDYDGTSDSGAKQYTLGADYALSKRTTAYAFYAKIKNDTNAGFGFGSGGGDSDSVVGNLNADPSVVSVGLKHVF